MAIKKLNPYLNFDGTAAEAIKLYERVLDAKTEGTMRFGDMPGSDTPPQHKDRVIHALLHIGEGVIMISDTMPGTPFSTEGTNTHVCVDFSDADDMVRRFDALAAGGKVTMPVSDTFWGAKFGMLTDRFGVRWMFNCTLKQS
jgi:PhnB protein